MSNKDNNPNIIKIQAKDLKIGMYVDYLDKPWIETKFLFQGFLLENHKQIFEVRNVSKLVYIDAEKSLPSVIAELKIQLPDPVRADPKIKITEIKRAPNKDRILRLWLPTFESTRKGFKTRLFKLFGIFGYWLNRMFLRLTRKAKKIEKMPSNTGNQAAFKAEVVVARDAYLRVGHALNAILTKLRAGKIVALSEVKACVSDLVSIVSRSPEMMMVFSSLRTKRKSTVRRSVNASILATYFGVYLQLEEELLSQLCMAALMHDVGEINIPNFILEMPEAELTGEERTLKEGHTTDGMEILLRIADIPWEVVVAAYSHHEKIDGTGYPVGLEDGEISFICKVIAIIDQYEALTNCENIERRVSLTDALQKIYGLRRTAFDNNLSEKFINCLGVYPVGTAVEISDGSIGVVIGVRQGQQLLPTVAIIYDPSRAPLPYPRIMMLDDLRGEKGKPLFKINHVIQPKDLDVDISAYLFEINRGRLSVGTVSDDDVDAMEEDNDSDNLL